MPARAESLAITERYRSGMIRLRKQGQAEAKRIWRSVSPDDLDGTFNVGLLELTVSTLQREAARLSSAYLASFVASELGEPENPPALSVWDKTFNGNPLREGLRSAVIAAKTKIGEGDDPRKATNASRAILVDTVGLHIDTAARESLRQGMEMDDRIVGYQRALKGTCGACSGSTSYEAFSENAPVVPLNVHPNCQCVAEPVVTGKPPRELKETQISAEDRVPLDFYMGSSDSFRMNRFLREGKLDVATSPLSPQDTLKLFKERIAGLDQAFTNAGPIGTPVRTFRGMKSRPSVLVDEWVDKMEDLVGKTFTEKGFGSSSGSVAEAHKFALGQESTVLDLTIDPRVKAIWGANPSEAELLTERGCRYVIRSVKKEGMRWKVHADVLPPK